MKIALTTVDLVQGRERLMPWRTVIEVAKYANAHGQETEVLTLPVQKDNVNYEFEGVKVKSAPRDFHEFANYVKVRGYDVVAYPTPWREGLKNLSAFKEIGCKKVAYFPGGSYRLENIKALWKHVGWQTAKPYLLDWLTPYRLLMGKLKNVGFDCVVAQSPYTAETCKRGGFGKVSMTVPGKDNFENLVEDIHVFERLKIKKHKYLLFSGAPAPIRGASFLLKALDKIAEENPDIFCVFLMRKDVGSDYSVFDKAYQELKHKECVQIIFEKVNRNELKTVMAHARAVMLPFLLVPSEIPITFFEVLSLGTPVVTFRNGGTTDYLKDGVLSSKPGDVNGLCENLQRIWANDEEYRLASIRALGIMSQHPSWDEVGKSWLEVLTSQKQ